jgi:hypothetical protein
VQTSWANTTNISTSSQLLSAGITLISAGCFARPGFCSTCYHLSFTALHISQLALQTLQPSQEADEARRVVVADMQQLVSQVSATLSSRTAAGCHRMLYSGNILTSVYVVRLAHVFQRFIHPQHKQNAVASAGCHMQYCLIQIRRRCLDCTAIIVSKPLALTVCLRRPWCRSCTAVWRCMALTGQGYTSQVKPAHTVAGRKDSQQHE